MHLHSLFHRHIHGTSWLMALPYPIINTIRKYNSINIVYTSYFSSKNYSTQPTTLMTCKSWRTRKKKKKKKNQNKQQHKEKQKCTKWGETKRKNTTRRYVEILNLHLEKEYFYDATLRSLLRFVSTKHPSLIFPTMADQHLIQASESGNISQTS